MDTKEQIFQYIDQHPGSHLRQIKRDLNVSMGVIQYHLYTLEKNQQIVSHRRGLYKRFYPALVFGEPEKEILDVLSQETERDLLLYLIENPEATQKDLSEYARISPGTTNWHMKRLISSNLVTVKRDGQFVKYSLIIDSNEILRLLKSYHPTIWDKWVDRIANAISAVSPLEEAEPED